MKSKQSVKVYSQVTSSFSGIPFMVFPFQYSGISKGKGSKWNFTFDVDVTTEFLKTEDDYVALFDWLNSRKEIDQKAFSEISCVWTEKGNK